MRYFQFFFGTTPTPEHLRSFSGLDFTAVHSLLSSASIMCGWICDEVRLWASLGP